MYSLRPRKLVTGVPRYTHIHGLPARAGVGSVRKKKICRQKRSEKSTTAPTTHKPCTSRCTVSAKRFSRHRATLDTVVQGTVHTQFLRADSISTPRVKRGETRTLGKIVRLKLHFRSASALSLSATRTRRTAPLLGRTASAPAPLPCTAQAAPLRALLFVPHLRFINVGWYQVVSRLRFAGITRSNHDTTSGILLALGGSFAKQNKPAPGGTILLSSNPLDVSPVVADDAQDSQKHLPKIESKATWYTGSTQAHTHQSRVRTNPPTLSLLVLQLHSGLDHPHGVGGQHHHRPRDVSRPEVVNRP